MAKAKAVHYGHCQCCGHLQKLPNERMSLHGYKVKFGWFMGRCQGTYQHPYEVSCELIKKFIISAQTALTELETRMAALRASATEPVAMVHNYEGETYGRNEYVWRRVTIQTDTKRFGENVYDQFFYVAPGPNGKKDVRHDFQYYETPGDGTAESRMLILATKLNTVFANWLEHQADGLRRYISWQQERVDSWTPAPLLDVKVKDKAGFEPTKAAYEGRVAL